MPDFVQREDQLYPAYQQQPWLNPTEEKLGLLAALGSLLGGSSVFRDKILRLIMKGFA